MSAFDSLLDQIDSFIRKYYKSELLKGLILVLGFLLSSWLIVSILEYFGRFSSVVRLLFFLFFIFTNSYFLIRYFALPLMKLFSFGKRINRFQAASIIGRFFPTVLDRLLNTLQLNDALTQSTASVELLKASVQQRSKDLLSVRFVDAVKFTESKRYIKFVLPIFLVFISIFIVRPNWIVKGSSNVVNFSKAQEAPFQFDLISPIQPISEGSAYEVKVKLSGLYIPNEVMFKSNRGAYKMKQIRKDVFVFTIDNLKSDLSFVLFSDGFSSQDFRVPVFGLSSLGNLQAKLIFPSYIKRNPERLSNIADLTIPEGTRVEWDLAAKNVSSIQIKSANFSSLNKQSKLQFSSTFIKDDRMLFLLKNAFQSRIDTSVVQITVLKDAFPSISVNETIDSLKSSIRFFTGSIGDDYGLSSLFFHYEIQRVSGQQIKRKFAVLSPKGLHQDFSFAVDFSKDKLALNDQITYYFTVSDNDQINGSKTTRSQQFQYALPSLTDLNANRDLSNNQIKSSLNQVLKKVEKFKMHVSKFQKQLIQKNSSDFKTMEQVQSLQQQQQQLQDELKAIQEKFAASNEQKNALTEQDKSLLEQQEMIEKLLNEVMDDELKKLLQDLQQLLEKNQDSQVKTQSKLLETSSDKLKSQMDRTLEMLKRMQVDEKIDDLEKELEELSKAQDNLNEKLSKEKDNISKFEKQQDSINKRFDELKNELKELDKLNQELDKPMSLDTNQDLQQEIDKSLNDSKENVSKNSKNKASQSQKNASKQMKQLASELNQQQENSKAKQNEEDMNSIRILLENLIHLSLSQEDLMHSFSKARNFDQRYTKLGKRQRNIIDDTKSVQDSLLQIAKRQPKISSFIDKELSDINTNFDLISEEFRERKLQSLLIHQQYVMTSYNNLALMLNESLQQMQAQSNPMMSGSGSCSNPNGSGKKPSSGENPGEGMKEMLKKQLEQLKKGMNPGGKSPGDKPGEEGLLMPGLSNQQISKMAAQQMMLRQQLEQMRNELNKDGSGTGNKLNPLIQDIDKQVNDLVNKRFNQDMIRRQQDILTRLLEADNATRTRGFEDKRESISGKNSNFGNLIRFDEYKRIDKQQVDVVKSIEPMLSMYYKTMAFKYLNLH